LDAQREVVTVEPEDEVALEIGEGGDVGVDDAGGVAEPAGSGTLTFIHR
jgi:hypothetical protein